MYVNIYVYIKTFGGTFQNILPHHIHMNKKFYNRNKPFIDSVKNANANQSLNMLHAQNTLSNSFT